MKTFNVYLESEATYGQTDAGCHSVYHRTEVGTSYSAIGALFAAINAMPHGNFSAVVNGKILKDVRADTAECLRALNEGQSLFIGMGSTNQILVTTESLENESVNMVDAENLHYQKTTLGA